MHNLTFWTIETEDGRKKLVIEIDISPEAVSQAPPSSTGRTQLVATSKGWIDLDSISFCLNVMEQKRKR